MRVDPDTQTSDSNDQLSSECVDLGTNLEFGIVRRAGFVEAENAYFTADCMLSGCAELQCPNLF